MLLDPQPWIEMCINDFCAGKDNFCTTAEQYFRQCNRHNKHIEWRNEGRCPLSCQPSFVYKQCGSACPRTCQQTAFKCDNTCIDGCHCPEDQFLHNGKCISQKECPCYSHGKEYKSGETIQEECNTCVCEAGAWSCTEKVCQAVCKVTGVDHFTTFDSTKFNFVGACSYTLVESLLEEDWAVFVKFSKCEQHVKLLCQKSLEIKVINILSALTVASKLSIRKYRILI